MARLTGALFSLAASGTIADTLTFAKWKGVQYVRTRVIPANPDTAGQQAVRGVFISLNELWKRMPTMAREPWIAAVAGLPLTPRNRHIQANVKLLVDNANWFEYVWSVSGGSAVPPASFATVGGVGLMRVLNMNSPTPPVGHTFSKRVACCIEDGDPSTTGGIVRPMYCHSVVSENAPFNIANVPAGVYRTGGWFEWTRDSDGKLFYSTFLDAAGTVT